MWYVFTAVLAIMAGIVLDQLFGITTLNEFYRIHNNLMFEFDRLHDKFDAVKAELKK